MSRVLQSSIRAGESIVRSAERLLQADAISVHIPRYIQELSNAARFPRGPGDPSLYEAAIKTWRSRIDGLGQGRAGLAGEYTIRSATEQLVSDLRGAKPAQIDGIVNRWVLDRVRYQARVVARNESVDGFRDVQIEGARQQPWTHGMRWTTSGGHAKRDVCDVLANQDLYGLGPGGYPLDRIPSRHSGCLCSLATISDPHYLKRETAKLRGTEEPPKPWLSNTRMTGEEWLLKQPEAAQLAILGPRRAVLLNRGESVMTRDHSSLRKVHNMLGKPAPVRDMGTKIDATPLVAADQAKMRQQFTQL